MRSTADQRDAREILKVTDEPGVYSFGREVTIDTCLGKPITIEVGSRKGI
jgi:hypothetical protein